MSAPVHRLTLRGCAPRPLAAYLKALGVLRIVAEQADPGARGSWSEDGFVLFTRLDEQALIRFFLWDWAPSPMVSPWNKGSGLLGSDPKGVDPVATSTAPRFAELRAGIEAARALTTEMQQAVADESALKDLKTRIKDKAGKERLAADPQYKARLAEAARRCKRLKDELQPECQRRWRGGALRWLRASVVIDAEGKATFPALLGTGGNDGKLDFTNNSLQRLGNLFDLKSLNGEPLPGAEAALRAALFGEPGPVLLSGAIGQYAPSAAGGANATSGPLGDSALNPWDLPLLLEGALLFTAGTSRRLGCEGAERTVAPFSARGLSAGYGSAAGVDESARGEQWMPLWDRPWTAGEVSALLREGRCQLGSRPSETALDVARAVARLGVARGVSRFERYAYIERNGKSNYAVPLGQWVVRADPTGALLDDLEAGDWWVRLRRAARDEHAPQSLSRLERRLEDEALAALHSGGERRDPARWQRVLLALVELEAQLVSSGAFTAAQRSRPIPPLQPAWIQAVDDASGELRLALALASAGASHDARGRPVDPVRRHWLPLDDRGGFHTTEGGLFHDPGVVLGAGAPEVQLAALVQRRLVEAAQGSRRALPLVARPGFAARWPDLMALLRGEVDLARVLKLARGLAALDWARVGPEHAPAAPETEGRPDPVWACFRLCLLPAFTPGDRARLDLPTIPVDPQIHRLLAAGDGPRAFALARARLVASGVRPPVKIALIGAERARALAASLAFPVSPNLVPALVRSLDPEGAIEAKEPVHVR